MPNMGKTTGQETVYLTQMKNISGDFNPPI